MAKIYPFSAVRPKKGLESRIAALPYDVYNRKEAKEVVEKEPMSFLKILRMATKIPISAKIINAAIHTIIYILYHVFHNLFDFFYVFFGVMKA